MNWLRDGWLGRTMAGWLRRAGWNLSVGQVDEWIDLSLTGRMAAAGVRVSESTALQHVPVWACVRNISEDVASLPLHLYERLERGKRRAVDHALYDVLHSSANEEMDAMTVRQTLQAHLLTWGNAYAEIERDLAGRIKGLWPLRPNAVRPDRDPETKRLRYLIRVGGQDVVLPRERVFHLAGLGFDGLQGYSPIAMQRNAVGLGMATEEFGSRFFSNGAVPGLVLRHPKTLGKDAYDRLRASWKEQHEGLSNAQRMTILEEGVEVEKIGLPPEDAQFLLTRKFQLAEMARMYRVPLHKVGELDRATNNNIEHQSIEYVVDCIRPNLVRWEQGIRRQLLGPRERQVLFAEHLVEGLLRGDTKARYDAYGVGRQWGWLSANDVRERENLNPVEGGDQYMVPLNMVPADQAGAAAQARLARMMSRNTRRSIAIHR